jgi:DNA-binding NarL/FixJ family response regulator
MPDTLKRRENPAESSDTRVLILDDQPIVRERLVQLIMAEPGLTVCGEADDARQANQLVATSRPKLVITSLSLKHSHGLDFIKDLHAAHPQLLILVFSYYDELIYAERAIKAGARGYIGTHAPTKELLRAIHVVLEGEIYLSEKVTVTKVTRFFSRSPNQPSCPIQSLSDRELQVLQLVGHGQTTSQVARALHLDVKTVETYRARIKVKLNLDTSAQLAQHARQWLEQATRRN